MIKVCLPVKNFKDNAMNKEQTKRELSHLLWTDALCTTPPRSSGQKVQHPPALTEEVSESASLHRYGRSAQLLRLLEITPPDSEQPGIELWATLLWCDTTLETDQDIITKNQKH